MFWAIGIGITVGADTTILAIIGSVVIWLAILFVQALEIFNTPYMLIVSLEKDYNEADLLKEVAAIYPKYQIRNKSIQKDDAEYTFEVRGKKELTSKVDTLKKLNGVKTVMLLSYRGDYVVWLITEIFTFIYEGIHLKM